jgi:hypothetical protein
MVHYVMVTIPQFGLQGATRRGCPQCAPEFLDVTPRAAADNCHTVRFAVSDMPSFDSIVALHRARRRAHPRRQSSSDARPYLVQRGDHIDST